MCPGLPTAHDVGWGCATPRARLWREESFHFSLLGLPLLPPFCRHFIAAAKQQKEAFLRNAETLEKFIINSFTSGSIAGATAGVGEYTFSPITALITRLRTIEPVGRQTISADILTLKTDAYKNILLMGGDELFIPKRPNSVNVVGEVLNTATLNFEANS